MEQQIFHHTEAAASRQMKIEQCLLDNLTETDFERISVADMCRQMGISRRLFYTYFPDKETCLFSLIDRMIQDSMLPFSSTDVSDHALSEMTIDYLLFWKKHSDFLEMIVRQHMKGVLVDRCFLNLQKRGDYLLKFLSTAEVKADNNVLWLYAAIRLLILFQWHEQDYHTPVEEMAVKYLRLLQEPILQKDLFEH